VDEVWNDRYSSQSGGFKKRSQGMKGSLRRGEGVGERYERGRGDDRDGDWDHG